MARTFEELQEKVRPLSADDRMHLLCGLIADLDGAMDQNVETAWLEEAERRHRELKEGLVEPVPADQMFAQARTQIEMKREEILAEIQTGLDQLDRGEGRVYDEAELDALAEQIKRAGTETFTGMRCTIAPEEN